MATLYQQLQKAKKLNHNKVSKDIFRYIRSIEKYIVDLNRDQIEKDSQDIYGKAIGFYSQATDLITGGRKKAGDPFTGKDTGNWLKAFYMQEVSGVLRFNSSDPKTSVILKSDAWLSDELFGLTDENLQKVIDEKLLPFFLEYIRKELDI